MESGKFLFSNRRLMLFLPHFRPRRAFTNSLMLSLLNIRIKGLIKLFRKGTKPEVAYKIRRSDILGP